MRSRSLSRRSSPRRPKRTSPRRSKGTSPRRSNRTSPRHNRRSRTRVGHNRRYRAAVEGHKVHEKPSKCTSPRRRQKLHLMEGRSDIRWAEHVRHRRPVSDRRINSRSSLRWCHSGLPHIFPATLLVGHFALLIRLIKKHLSNSLISIYFGG